MYSYAYVRNWNNFTTLVIGVTGAYLREGTTSRVMAADKNFGEFYDFYTGSPEYFGYTLV
jgi:hypothetical protein